MDSLVLPGEEAGPAEVGDDHGQEILLRERTVSRHSWRRAVEIWTGRGEQGPSQGEESLVLGGLVILGQ